jgi:hypothetical protein
MVKNRSWVAAALTAAALAVMFGWAMVAYLLWKGGFGGQARVGTDLLQYGIIFPATGSILALSVSMSAKRTIWVGIFLLGVLAAISIFALHASGMACTSKQEGVCDPIWPSDERPDLD